MAQPHRTSFCRSSWRPTRVSHLSLYRVMKWAWRREVAAFVFCWHHAPPLPPPAAVCARFQLYGSSDMCHALETAVEWLSLTSIFPDRPHWWLLGKQGTEWLESALLNDLSPGRRSGQRATLGIGQTALELQRSHRNMQSNAGKKKKRVSGDTKSGSQCAYFLYKNVTLA